jgi:Zn-dependent protease
MLITSLESINSIIVVGLVVSFTLTFLAHELVHKIVAQHYGLWAEFRLMLFGALLTLLSIIVPFPKFIAPGAVMIAGAADKKTIGKTSVAGPLTNIVFCGVSFALTFVKIPILFEVALLTAAFNAFIAVINLIPFAILDGLKVFEWNKLVWVLAFGSSVALLIGIAVRYPSLFGL